MVIQIMKQKRIISLLLLSAIIFSIGCSNEQSENVTDNSEDTVTHDSVNNSVEYEFTRYDGYEFRVLNADDIYSMHAKIDSGEINGDTLNDAEYERCRTLENKTGIKFIETNVGVDNEVISYAQKSILANDDDYDIMYIPARNVTTLSSEGYLHNLLDLDNLQLDSDWWLSQYNNASTIGGNLYAAASYSQLMIIDSISTVYYNETLGEKLGLDAPYQIVKDGNWTFDTMQTYMKAAATLNGDNSFDWDVNGNCIYGISLDHPQSLVICAGEQTIEAQNGELVFTSGSDRYYNVISKIVNVFTENDGSCQYRHIPCGDDDPGHQVYTFEHERSLMLVTELSKTNRMRDKDYSFGVLPMPKYDNEQENYISIPFYGTPCLTIPVTSPDPEKVASISDALAYLSYTMVWDVFRNVTLEQKNLRNEDSIDMLDIMINTTVPSLKYIYGIGEELEVAVKDKMMEGDDSVASIVASYESQIRAKLNEITSK